MGIVSLFIPKFGKQKEKKQGDRDKGNKDDPSADEK